MEMMPIQDFSIHPSFWLGLGAIAVVVIIMLVVCWSLPPKKN